MRRILALIVAIVTAGGAAPRPAQSKPPDADIVIRACDISQAALTGAWTLSGDEGAAGGVKLVARTETSAGSDAVAAANALSHSAANPIDYFDVTFTAPPDTPYRVWLRVRIAGDVRTDVDAVWLQFSDALVNRRPAYREGTADALLIAAEPCSGCARSGWGWQDSSWSLNQPAIVTFADGGQHTVRIQAISPGVEIDQIVLSPRTYFNGPPGPSLDDATRVRRQ